MGTVSKVKLGLYTKAYDKQLGICKATVGYTDSAEVGIAALILVLVALIRN